ncbi:hypothetical protein A5791_07890 [Mycobacterium sp. 852002-51163_SCH5372311]|uniref:hypothetical protein n=1 Tax=Mycobacterium sp. 852002-51163_SCH5372311 TaxID=1834097 RepID=UPI00080107DC|nr:hypothetical protein [Mycobacterium sp. 852002-51163_SCH5372311]OBF80504.1 hypothetical protein A5791_07890 [Mycobacterium sp. 852002-51163_SCH5372311]
MLQDSAPTKEIHPAWQMYTTGDKAMSTAKISDYRGPIRISAMPIKRTGGEIWKDPHAIEGEL